MPVTDRRGEGDGYNRFVTTQIDIFSELSGRQKEAVQHAEGPLLIVAGPGSGKTRVMAHRIAYLTSVQGVAPWRILAVTFTNKSARELRERAAGLVGGANTGLQVRTFHSFCAFVLRQDGGQIGLDPAFSIYDGDDQQKLVRNILEELELDPKQFAPRAILSGISDAKNKMIDDSRLSKISKSYFEEVVARVYARYTEQLATANAVDFDDLLLRAHNLFEDHADVLEKYQDRYRHVLVDEFQDTNAIQFSLTRLLAAKHKNICVVGDPDQSIYSWRHADIRNLTDFQTVYPDAVTVTLDQSYRSTQTILEAASGVIANNDERLKKNLWTENDKGSPITVGEAYDEDEEARVVLQEINRLVEEDEFDRQEIAVMYRTNAQSRAMEAACNRHGVVYQLVGGTKFYERKEIRDTVAYLRLTVNPSDDAALERIVNVPARGISPRSVGAIRAVARSRGTSMLNVILQVDDEEQGLFGQLNPRAVKSVRAFADLMERLIEQSIILSAVELLDLTLERSGYKRLVQEDKERGEERWDNILELRGSASNFEGPEPRERLIEFLENVALVSDIDSLEEGEDAITLITLHQAKGLEYDAVFMIGMEEGLLPHSRSLESGADLEEERRLCYVGMTRARKRLYMFHAFQRGFRGSRGAMMPSRFLDEIPLACVETVSIRRNSNTVRKVASTRNVTGRSYDPTVGRRRTATPLEVRAAQRGDYRVADRVFHDTFGDGIVIEAIETGGDTEVTVAFGNGNGLKKLMAAFSGLKKVKPGDSTKAKREDPELGDAFLDAP
ncbi:MAG: UvrD-helicase domain-containing protein [Dehalococcoidia bacterium]|nr:UvrD-helicase domain-containing protein [Dehalococcoidia bacterium]